MATEIIVPHLGESVETAILAAWLKQPGDEVRRGDAIADIETDKATMPLECPVNGVVLDVCVAAGTEVRIGQLLARVGSRGEALETTPPAAIAPSAAPAPVSPEPIATPVTPQTAPPVSRPYRVTPLARRMAKELGVDLSKVQPGRGDKIGGADVEKYHAAQRTGGQSMAASAGASSSASVPARRVPLSSLRRIVGKRMTASAQTVPQFAVSAEADATRLLEFHAALKASGREVSLTALLVRLTATALQAHPGVNAQFDGDDVLIFQTVNMAVAVATPDGLRVPVVRGAEQLTLLETARRLDDLARLAREGRLAATDVDGATFTMSNLGMFGVSAFTPIVNPPHAAILGVGAPRPMLTPGPDGRPQTVQPVTLTVSADHRALDGADVAAFLKTLSAEIERCLILRVE